MPQLDCDHTIGDKVMIDNDPSLIGTVTAVEFRRTDVVRYEVSWITNGDAKFTMFDEWRVKAVA